MTIGYLQDPRQRTGTIDTTASTSRFNAVQVRIRRVVDQNGQVPTFFGRVLGSQGFDANATATAAFINNFNGFTIPSTGDGNNLLLLPFALDLQTWNALLANDTSATTDKYRSDSAGHVTAGSDGVREVNLFPQGTGSPGNRGTVDIGSRNNSNADICRQIVYGVSADDLSYFPNSQLAFDAHGHLYLNGDTGISAGCKSALASIIGQIRCIPIFASVSGPGNNAMYDIVAWAGVRIMDVDLTGSMSSKHLTVQPATFFTRGAVPSTSTTVTSYGVYSPVWLVR